MEQPDRLREDFDRVGFNAAKKREALLRMGARRSDNKKNLTIWSGILALLSATTIAGLTFGIIGNKGIQFFALLGSMISGIISLFLANHYNDEDTINIFNAATKYLALRDKAYRLSINPDCSGSKAFKQLENLHAEYVQLDELYAKYTAPRVGIFDRFRRHNPFSMRTSSHYYERMPEWIDENRG